MIREVTVEARFAGPIPHPDLLRGYEQVCPGSAERIIAMAEREMSHRHKKEEKLLEMQGDGMRLQFTESRIGQFCALAVSGLFLGVGAYVAVSGQPWVGGILGSMGIGSIVANFLQKSRESEQAPASRGGSDDGP